MLQRAFVFLVLSTAAGLAATPNFLLGLNYSEWGPYFASAGSTNQIAADASGALYMLSQCTQTVTGNGPSCLTKLSPDGKTVAWQNSLGAFASNLAVDPSGGIYLILTSSSSTSASIEKLSTDGKSVLWSTPMGGAGLAVDATGRAFVLSGYSVTRLSPTGAIDATFPNVPLYINPGSIAVDPTGSHIVVAYSAYPTDTFARLGTDNATWVPFSPPLGTLGSGIAVAPNGDAVIYGTDFQGNRSLQRIDPTGAVVFTKAIASQTEPGSSNEEAPGRVAVDAAGNAYITSYTGAFGTPVRNSLAPCGSAWLGVYAPDGTVLQTTYLPGGTSTQFAFGLIALGGSAVFVLDVADTSFTPTQTGPFPQYPNGSQVSPASYALFHLSLNAGARTMPLACAASAATFLTGAVAAGELVALYGNSLGPAVGVETEATLESPFATQAGGTEVTFDGTPAPLLWVQDSQVNVAVPWSVAGPTTQICVTYNRVKTNCLTWPVGRFAPGVFTVDGVHAAAVNQDGTVNSASNPAPLNSVVSIWATGLGPISPAQSDGSLVGLPLPVNASPVALGNVYARGIGGPGIFLPFPTAYTGPAPFLIAGTTQVNFSPGDTLSNGQPTPSFTLEVGGGAAISNAFQVYVAGTNHP